HVPNGVLELVVLLADRGGREGVRGRDIGPRLEVGVVDRAHDVRPGEVQQIRVTLDVVVVSGEPLAAEVRLLQPPALQEYAPGPVEHHDALGEELLQPAADVVGHVPRDYRRVAWRPGVAGADALRWAPLGGPSPPGGRLR